MSLGDALSTRPRVLNLLHLLRLARPATGTTHSELACLARHARGRRTALEIGTHMGVSAVIIATSIDPEGTLYCVDPWPKKEDKENPSFRICKRELMRRAVEKKVRFIRTISADALPMIPESLDFIFVDGDHSRAGIAVDWDIVRARLAPGGIACFHDTLPAADRYTLPSAGFFDDTISRDPDFSILETCNSLSVLERKR